MKTESIIGNDKIFNDILKSKLKQFDEQIKRLERKRKAILELLASTPKADTGTATIPFKEQSKIPLTHKSAIEKIVQFLQSHNGPAKARQFMNYLESEGISFAGSENPMAYLFAILSHENRKPNGKIERVGEGLYALRKSEG